MQIVLIFAFALISPSIVLAGGTRTEKCNNLASDIIEKTNVRIQEQPEPRATGYNEYSNPWQNTFRKEQTNFCCVSYNAEPPFSGKCSAYERDICVDMRTMEVASDTLVEGTWCGY